MPRYAKRTDRTQTDIVLQLREWGFVVHDFHQCGWGVPDLIVCRGRRCEWVEVKVGRLEALTDLENVFYDICPGGPPIIAWTADLVRAEFDRRLRDGAYQ